MANKFAQAKYIVKNQEKYIGKGTPTYRSGWEFAFMQFCDNHPSIINWASESIKIPYKNPLTGRNTIYVPDFLIVYQDRNGNTKAEVIEVKPKKETALQFAGRSAVTHARVAVNMAKWEAARLWCYQNQLTFRVVTEDDIFHNPSKPKKGK